MIIIPDVHGRFFWKNSIKGHETEEIIFLGDYTDPYSYEGVTYEQTLKNFKEILKFKKEHNDNVTLLLGNHDLCYISNDMPRCRFDYNNHDELSKLFRENISLFKLMHHKIINGRFVTFSHSYIGKHWLNKVYDFYEKDIIEIEKVINDHLHALDNSFITRSMRIAGHARGGEYIVGSLVWSDISEILEEGNKIFDIDFQIFGHTQLQSQPIITNDIACLDVREGFELTDDGILISEPLHIEQKLF